MTILSKEMATTIIPGNPGVPAVPGRPGTPAHCVTETHQEVRYITQQPSTWVSIPNSNPNVMGSGYDSGGILLNTGSLTVKTVVEVKVDVCYPAVPAIPGTPGVPPTPAQIINSLNSGWNTSARSISPLDLGSCLVYTLSQGINGALYGVAPAGIDVEQEGIFAHALLVDQSGVHAFENGAMISSLMNTQRNGLELRIYRGENNEIFYVAVIEGRQAIMYQSATPASVSPAIDLYVYGYLYSSGDFGLSAEFRSGEVQFGKA
jgi:hypothetical protein